MSRLAMCICKHPFFELSNLFKTTKLLMCTKGKRKKSSISGSEPKAKSGYKGCSQNWMLCSWQNRPEFIFPWLSTVPDPTEQFHFFKNTEFPQDKQRTITHLMFTPPFAAKTKCRQKSIQVRTQWLGWTSPFPPLLMTVFFWSKKYKKNRLCLLITVGQMQMLFPGLTRQLHLFFQDQHSSSASTSGPYEFPHVKSAQEAMFFFFIKIKLPACKGTLCFQIPFLQGPAVPDLCGLLRAKSSDRLLLEGTAVSRATPQTHISTF